MYQYQLPKFLKIWLIAITVLLLANTAVMVFLIREQSDLAELIDLKYQLIQADIRLKELETAKAEYEQTHPAP